MSKDKLRDLCESCKSSKITMRKRGVDGLLEELNNPESLSLLNSLSSTDTVNWNVLFKSAHLALISASEKWRENDKKVGRAESGITKDGNDKSIFLSLVEKILINANRSTHMYIDCDNILQACFSIFLDKYLRKNFGLAYIDMLRLQVLPIRKFRSSMTSSDWDELFDHLLNIFKNINCDKDWFICSVIELMKLVVEYGCQQAHLSLQVKNKLLPLLEEKFPTLHVKAAVEDPLLSLVLCAFVNVGKESRTAMCQLGELILHDVLKMYNPREADTSARNMLVVSFLLFQVKCHHPNGAREGHGSAYAYNWKKWNNQAYLMYCHVVSTVLKKQKIQNLMPFSDSFLDLCVELCNLFFDKGKPANASHLNETYDPDGGPSAKRRKWVTGTEELFEELLVSKKEVTSWPLVALISRILQKYPILFHNADLHRLLEILCEIQCNCTRETMAYICECCENLLKVMVKRGLNPDMWRKVWDAALRTAGLNQNECHPLLQTLMMERVVPTSAMEALIRMFQSRTIQLTNSSLQTLMTLISYYCLPESSSSVQSCDQFSPWELPITSARVHLLDWLCSASSNSAIDMQMLAKVLAILIVKTKGHQTDVRLTKCSSDRKLKELSLEDVYCISAFEGDLDLSENSDSLRRSDESIDNVCSTFVDTTSQTQLELLLGFQCDELDQKISQLHDEITSLLKPRSPLRDLKLKADLTCEAAKLATLLVHVLSCMIEYGVITKEDFDSYCLKEKLSATIVSLEKLISVVLNSDNYKNNEETLEERTTSILLCLEDLYRGRLHPVVSYFLREMTSSASFVPIVKLATWHPKQEQPDNNLDNLNIFQEKAIKSTGKNLENFKIFQEESLPFSKDSNTPTPAELIRFHCLHVLTAYSCVKQNSMHHSKERTVITQILKILDSEEYDLKLETTFNMVHYCVCAILSRFELDLDMHVKRIVRIVQSLCKTWNKDAEASSYIILILKGLFRHAAPGKWERVACIGLLTPFKNKTFGPRFTIQFISCFEEFLKVDKNSDWSRWSHASDFREAVDSDSISREALVKFEDPERKVAIVEESILFLLSPFHEVRLAAVFVVARLFHGRHHTPRWMEIMFKRVSEVLYATFIRKGADMSEAEANDEGCNRTATVLLVLYGIIAGSVSCNKQALLLTYRLLKEKHLKIDLIKKIFDALCKPMKLTDIQNYLVKSLGDVLNEWFLWGFRMQEFPFCLVNATSFSDFVKKFNEIILPIVWKSKDQPQLVNIISDETGSSPSEIFEACFAPLYAQHLAFSISFDVNSCRESSNLAKKHFESFKSEAGNEKIKQFISDKIVQILVYLSNLVWDPVHHEELLGLQSGNLKPIGPYMSRDCFSTALKHIQSALGIKPDLLEYINSERPIVIQQVLLQLRENIQAAVTQEQKLRSLESYTVFAHSVAIYLEKDDFSHTADFYLCDITHTLLYLIVKSESNELLHDVCLGSCSFLFVLYSHLLPACASALNCLLPTIVGSLIPLTNGSEKLSLKSFEILKLLIQENSDCLKDAIGCLPPFPETPQFEEIQSVHNDLKYKGIEFSLEDEIKHFLSSAGATTNLAHQNSMLHGLHFLRKQLSENKNELSSLYKNLEHIRGFTEDCRESVIHQLVVKLISLTTAADSKVQFEALRCLGELGAADLTTLVLRPAEGCVNLVRGYREPMICVMAIAAHFLAEYLLDHDASVVKTASHALFSLMSCQGSTTLHSKNGAEVIASRKIAPFIPKKPTKPIPPLMKDRKRISSLLRNHSVWNPLGEINHEEWIVKLACSLLSALSDDDLFKDLAAVCKVKACFAEEMLPVLFYLGLTHSEDVNGILCASLNQFFENHCSTSRASSQTSVLSSNTSSIFLNKASVECLLNVVNFSRLRLAAKGDGRFYLKMNYRHLATAAQFCGAYLSSILYLELWCNGEDRPAGYDGSSIALVDFIPTQRPDDGKLLQTLLTKAYEQIGDVDAVYGCGSAMLLNSKARVKQYEYAGEWDKVILNHDVNLLHASNMDAANGLVNGLYHSGMFHTLTAFVDSLPPDQKEELLPTQLECVWRLGLWNKSSNSTANVTSFEWNQFSALQVFYDGNQSSVNEFVTKGRHVVLKELSHCSLENCKTIYKPLFKLQSLQEMEDFVTSDNIIDTIDKWKNQNKIPYHDLLLSEPIFAQRACLMETVIFRKNVVNSAENNSYLLQKLTQHYLETAALARKEGKTQVAEQWLRSLSLMPHLSTKNKRQLQFEEAQLAWSSNKDLKNGSSFIARQLLGSLLNELRDKDRESTIQSKLLPQALILYGQWMFETRSENPQHIIEEYLEEALQLLEQLSLPDSINELLEAHCCLAHFADLEYQRITAYIKSDTFQSKLEGIEELRKEANCANKIKPKDKETLNDHQRAVRMTLKYSELDEEEVKNTYHDQKKYIELAMRHYLMSLHLGEGLSEDTVFRMVSIWLENSNEDAVNKQVVSSLDAVQTYKFVVLLPQLAARVGNNKNDSFTKAIYKLLTRCCVEHPHHTLPLILALANSYADLDRAAKSEPEPRVLGAAQILDELQKNKLVSGILKEMEVLSKALISLAYAEIHKHPTKGYLIPDNEKIRKIGKLEKAMLPIITLPVQSDTKYSNIIGIQSFETTFSIAGGINRPKKIMCLGTDGIKRPVLVKGKDDLRQDAVMQQVFTILNKLLQTCQETRQRRLLIRTYKIVPLSQRCGVLQWCENTSPMAIVLRNFHRAYYPKDWKDNDCCDKIEKARNKSNGERLSVFKEICKHFHPVFRYFFTDTFPNPAEWLDHRMAYVHSVATNSMVGYILGLGDRHVSNILIDENTAELIHIDFGIAFEQGKLLPTPETVPFRLTRDLVDGMGVSGVEGVFQRSCEKTMTVLRKNQEMILTILEVLLYDPLYAWTITPKVASKIQEKGEHRRASLSSASITTNSDDGSESSMKTNKMAGRVLCRLKEKLQGTEEGPVSSIEGQVTRLIQQARDLRNLSRLFRGWQAFY